MHMFQTLRYDPLFWRATIQPRTFAKLTYFLTELEPKFRPLSDRPTFPALSWDAFRSALTG